MKFIESNITRGDLVVDVFHLHTKEEAEEEARQAMMYRYLRYKYGFDYDYIDEEDREYDDFKKGEDEMQRIKEKSIPELEKLFDSDIYFGIAIWEVKI